MAYFTASRAWPRLRALSPIRQVPIPKTGIALPEGILQERIKNFPSHCNAGSLPYLTLHARLHSATYAAGPWRSGRRGLLTNRRAGFRCRVERRIVARHPAPAAAPREERGGA